VLARVQNQNLGPVEAPKDFGLGPIERIHSRDYLDFFKGAWARWTEFNTDGDLLPYTWPAPCAKSNRPACTASSVTTASTAARRSPPAPGRPPTAQRKWR
jgi:acetoin utilization deacetylase AcuC-like enzyme